MIRRALGDDLPQGAGPDLEKASDDGSAERSPRDAGSDGDACSDDASVDLLAGRVRSVLQGLVDTGLIEVVARSEAAAAEVASSFTYRRVPPRAES